jgi:hypothetical protein
MERSFFPNCLRRVATREVCLNELRNYTERYYGFFQFVTERTRSTTRGFGVLMFSRARAELFVKGRR